MNNTFLSVSLLGRVIRCFVLHSATLVFLTSVGSSHCVADENGKIPSLATKTFTLNDRDQGFTLRQNFVTGLPATIDAELVNGTDDKFESLSAKMACSCIGLKFGSTELMPRQSLKLTFKVVPKESSYEQVIEVLGLTAESKEQRVCRFHVIGACEVPITLDRQVVKLDEIEISKSSSCKVGYVTSPMIHINAVHLDSENSSLTLKYVEADRTLVLHWSKDLSPEEFSAIIRFRYTFDNKTEGIYQTELAFEKHRESTIAPSVVTLRSKGDDWVGSFVLNDQSPNENYIAKLRGDSEDLIAEARLVYQKLSKGKGLCRVVVPKSILEERLDMFDRCDLLRAEGDQKLVVSFPVRFFKK